MNTLDLNAYGVSEMNQQELVETNGGFIGTLIMAGLVGAIVGHLVSSADEISLSVGTSGVDVQFTWR